MWLIGERRAELEIVNTRIEKTVQQRTAELATKNEQLIELKEDAEEANVAKSQFLANMSHELRTPMNAVLGYTRMLSMNVYGELPEKVRDVHQRIDKSGQHLLSLRNNISNAMTFSTMKERIHMNSP